MRSTVIGMISGCLASCQDSAEEKVIIVVVFGVIIGLLVVGDVWLIDYGLLVGVFMILVMDGVVGFIMILIELSFIFICVMVVVVGVVHIVLDIGKPDVSVVERRGGDVSVRHGGCVLAVVLGCLMLLGYCYSRYCGSMGDVGSVVYFRCGNSAVGSADDTVRYCFLQFGVG